MILRIRLLLLLLLFMAAVLLFMAIITAQDCTMLILDILFSSTDYSLPTMISHISRFLQTRTAEDEKRSQLT